MTTTAHLVTYRDLNRELRVRGFRGFSYSKLSALVAAGRIPSYLDHLRLMRGRPVRLFSVDEVVAVLRAHIHAV
jgi:hypothetical protein